FNRGFVDFDMVLQHFDWQPGNAPLTIDVTNCASANYQALALLIQYAWYLTVSGCTVTFKYGSVHQPGPTKMLTKMQALDWRETLLNDGGDFGYRPGRQTF